MSSPTRLECSGCGAPAVFGRTLPYRCPAAVPGDGIDHVVVRRLDAANISFPRAERDAEPCPFVRYRDLLHGRHVGRAAGRSEDEMDDVVRRADAAVAAVAGTGFVETPFRRDAALSRRLGMADGGGVFVKDETGNVGGSQKARHLFGMWLDLEMGRRTGLDVRDDARLAIASCGNAALAAGIVAKAAGLGLDVFVPAWAERSIVAELERLGASVTVCPRREEEAGDPCVHRFREAVAKGAVPFTCQGNENGLVIEGGQTLGWEIVSALVREERSLDRVFLQVGGGAFASATIAAFREARDLGVLSRLPRFFAVQTEGGAPLARAHARVVERIRTSASHLRDASPDELRDAFDSPEVQGALAYAARHRAEFMWPWDPAPRSVADGILDDETYDWRAVVTGLIESGGDVLLVSEGSIRAANEIAAAPTGNPVSYTGSAGLAGFLDAYHAGSVPADEACAVVFSGVRRSEG